MKALARIQHYLTTASNEVEFEAGQRVAVQLNTKKDLWYYGFIMEIKGKRAAVQIDRGLAVVDLNVPHFVPTGDKLTKWPIRAVEMWKDSPNGVPLAALVVTTKSSKELYTQNKSIAKFGTQTIKAMYTYVNYKIFNLTLPDIPVRLDTKSKQFGVVHYKWTGSKYNIVKMGISQQHHIIGRMFNTVAHEAIHVFQAHYATKPYLKSYDMHGPSFLHWVEPMKQKIGAIITTTTHVDQEVKYDSSLIPLDEKTAQYIVVFIRASKPLGFKTKDQMLVDKMLTYKCDVYRSSDKRILSALKNRRSEAQGTFISSTVYDHIKQTATLFHKQGDPMNARGLYGFYFIHITDPKFVNYPYGIFITSTDKDVIKAAKATYATVQAYDMSPHPELISKQLAYQIKGGRLVINHYRVCDNTTLMSLMPILKPVI